MYTRVAFFSGTAVFCLGSLAFLAFYVLHGASISEALAVLSSFGFDDSGLQIDPRHTLILKGLLLAAGFGFFAAFLVSLWFVCTRIGFLILAVVRSLASK